MDRVKNVGNGNGNGYAACSYASVSGEGEYVASTHNSCVDAISRRARPEFELTPRTRGVVDDNQLEQMRRYVEYAGPMLEFVPDAIDYFVTAS